MAEHLKIDGCTMVSAIQDIDRAKSAFDSIGTWDGAVASAAGCGAGTSALRELRGALHDAASGWDVHRKGLSSDLEALSLAMAQCIEQFESVDKQLADGMKSK